MGRPALELLPNLEDAPAVRLTRRQEFARLNERGRAFRDAEGRSEYVAVCLLGYEARVPRHFGDNEGAWPIRVATTAKPREITKRTDLESPIHRITVHDLVSTESDAHARELDRLLLGTSAESRALRHSWRDCADADPAVVWPILLGDALQAIEDRGERIEVFDEDERRRCINARALRRR